MDNHENPEMGNNQNNLQPEQGVGNNQQTHQQAPRDNTILWIIGGALAFIAFVFVIGAIALFILKSSDSDSLKKEAVIQQEESRTEESRTEESRTQESRTEETKIQESTGAGIQYSSNAEAESKVLSMSRQEKESLISIVESKTSPSGLRVYVEEIFLAASITNFNPQDPTWIACGEGNGKHEGVVLEGNGWLNGRKADNFDQYRLQKAEDGRWYVDLPDLLQFNFVQSSETFLSWDNLRFAKLEILKDGDWKPPYLYLNPQGAKGRVALDDKRFPVKG